MLVSKKKDIIALKKIKIVKHKNFLVISHVMTQPLGQVRWRKFASSFKEIDVCLLAPRIWTSIWLREKVIFSQNNIKDKNFEIRTLKTLKEGNDSYYLFKGIRGVLKKAKPDIIFMIGVNFAMVQVIIAKLIWAPKAKLVLFSMNAPENKLKWRRMHIRYPQNFIIDWVKWSFVLNGTDAVICHYPKLKKDIIKLGYKKPILVQTQIGINEDIYYPSEEKRIEKRNEIGLSNYTIGFAGRISEVKGIFDIADIMSSLPNNIELLVVGDGLDRERLIKQSKECNWNDRLFLTGYVPPKEVPDYMRAMDCLVVGSKTTSAWVDTFPNVVAQAMLLAIPVIGSSSGAIPFILGGLGLVFNESNQDELKQYIVELFSNPDLSTKIGNQLRERAIAEFSITSINNSFFSFITNNI
jgi:L-malate glycosyltransferase